MAQMRVLCIVQARLGSSRYPNKVLADICGKPMIAHVVERARAMETIDDVVVACPASDVEVETLQAALAPFVSVQVCGACHQDTVLSRSVEVAHREDVAADVVVRLTAD